MVLFILFLSLFMVALVIFFAFFPIKPAKLQLPRRRRTSSTEEIYDDPEL